MARARHVTGVAHSSIARRHVIAHLVSAPLDGCMLDGGTLNDGTLDYDSGGMRRRIRQWHTRRDSALGVESSGGQMLR